MKRSKIITNIAPLVSNEHPLDFHEEKFVENVVDQLEKREAPKQIAKYNASTLFMDNQCKMAYYLSKGGFTNDQIAEFLDIKKSVLNEWILHKETFGECIREGRTIFNLEVVETLSRRALGYDYVEKEVSQRFTRSGQLRTLTTVKHKHMPPDINAIIFWLKNRDKDNWADVNRTDINANVQMEASSKLNMDSFTDDEKNVLKKIMINKISQVHGVSNN